MNKQTVKKIEVLNFDEYRRLLIASIDPSACTKAAESIPFTIVFTSEVVDKVRI